MSGLKLYISNRLELLALELARVVRKPLPSALTTEIIIVQSRGMARWVSLKIADANGIAANIQFPFPNTFLQDVFSRIHKEPIDTSFFDPTTMTFSIMDLLPKCLEKSEFKALKSYVTEEPNDRKLFQISSKIAHLYDQYLIFRPDMISSWESEYATSQADHQWQAILWRKLIANAPEMHSTQLRKALFDAIRQQRLEVCQLPQRLSVFGISYLPRFHMETFAALAQLCDVNLFLMNPCREYWADIMPDAQALQVVRRNKRIDVDHHALHLEQGNRLLASLGKSGRDFFAMIHEFDCETIEMFQEPQNATLLAEIQRDILDLIDCNKKERDCSKRDSQTDLWNDGTVQFHSCHGPMREIEVLHDQLLAMFAQDDQLKPEDILIMTPDVETYAPFLEAVFGTQDDERQRIPFSIADKPMQSTNQIMKGLRDLLEMIGGRFGVSQVLALLDNVSIRQKFGLNQTDLNIIHKWIKDVRIKWGYESQSLAELGLPELTANTWAAGIQRLLLGYAMPGRNQLLFKGILPYDHIEGSQTIILGRFLDFLNAFFTFNEELKINRMLDGWDLFFNKWLDIFFIDSDKTQPYIQFIREQLRELTACAAVSKFQDRIDIKVMRDLLFQHFKQYGYHTGFLSGGVTFCAMLPMRSIPFKVICLIGLNYDTFPREQHHLSFDLIKRHPRRGDRSRRSDDKQLFLETILSARHKLYISFTGQDIRQHSKISPSVLVNELIDYIGDNYDAPVDRLIYIHPLQPFSVKYFQTNSPLFSYSRENWSACQSFNGDKASRIFLKDPLPLDKNRGLRFKQVTAEDLCAFFRNPTQFFLQERLGIVFEKEEDTGDDRENFKLDGLDAYIVGKTLLQYRLKHIESPKRLSLLRANGILPHGTVGRVYFSKINREVEQFANKIDKFTKDNKLKDQEVELELEDFVISAHLTELYTFGMMQTFFTSMKAKYILIAWIYHLILCAMDSSLQPLNRISYLLFSDTLRKFQPVTTCRQILINLLNLYFKGISQPINFFCETSYSYAQELCERNRDPVRALDVASRKWHGSRFVRGEADDPYTNLCFKSRDALNASFQQLALEVYMPVFAHWSQDIAG